MGTVRSETTEGRLIVLMPDSLATDLDVARKIYWIAQRKQCRVMYLTLVDDDEKMLTVARQMATMKAVTSSNHLSVDAKLVKTPLWLVTLKEIYQPGDQIVCHEEQVVKNGFLKTKPVTEFLRETMRVPIITISGFYHPQQVQVKQWLHNFVSWIGFLLILAAFTVLEINLDHTLHGGIGTVILAILVVLEIGAIWVWNSITG